MTTFHLSSGVAPQLEAARLGEGANGENMVSKPTKLHKSRCCLKQQTADRRGTAVGRLIFLGQVDLEEEQKINIYLPLIAKSQS